MVKFFRIVLTLFFFITSLCAQAINLENNQDQSPLVIDAEKSVICDEIARKCVATGSAKAQRGLSSVYGDILTVYYTKEREIKRVEADGHVRIETPTKKNFAETSDDSPLIINAQDSVVCDETMRRCVAKGMAKAQKGTSIVHGDVLTVYFTEGHEVTEIMADGHVKMETPRESAYGDHAHYDVALDRVLLTGGNLRLISPKQIITATDSIEYWHTKHEGIARGKAVARFPEKKELVQADKLVAYFMPPREGEKKTEIEKVEAIGNVLASNPSSVVTGDRALYHAQSGLVEVFGNVKITQGESLIEGEYGKANLKTNLAEIFPCQPEGPCCPSTRISGIIMPKEIKKPRTPCPKENPGV